MKGEGRQEGVGQHDGVILEILSDEFLCFQPERESSKTDRAKRRSASPQRLHFITISSFTYLQMAMSARLGRRLALAPRWGVRAIGGARAASTISVSQPPPSPWVNGEKPTKQKFFPHWNKKYNLPEDLQPRKFGQRWRKPLVSARTRAKLRKQAIVEGTFGSYDPQTGAAGTRCS